MNVISIAMEIIVTIVLLFIMAIILWGYISKRSVELEILLSSEEKRIIKWQHIVYLSTIIIFIIVTIITTNKNQPINITWFIICALYFYIGMSSYLNEISIINLKGRNAYAKGIQAKKIGIGLIIFGLISTIILFMLLFQDKITFIIKR